MELRQFIHIFKKHFTLFLSIVGIVVVGAVLTLLFRPTSYDTTLSLHIARDNQQTEKTDEKYNYDQFYRLQADERFADSVVRWLESPRIVYDILRDAELGGNSDDSFEENKFDARRLSSQFIEVRFSTPSEAHAIRIADAINTVLNNKTDELNKGGDNANWFVIVVDDPITREASIDPLRFGFLIGILAVFLGLLSILIWHYWKED